MNRRSRNIVLLWYCLAMCLSVVRGISRPSTIVFENNQFKNVVIAIHDSVPEDKSLIDTLKDTMTKASEYLFKATRQRAYFREITILLPASWTDDASYGSPTTQTLQFADVVITNPTRGKRSLPQTRSYSGCGKQGVHVLLTKEFLTDDSVEPYTNNSAKYFVHAFAQFRWGVFQEYAEDGETEFYFSPYYGRADAIKCAQGLRGLIVRTDTQTLSICYPTNSIDPHTNLYYPTCKWKPYPTRQRVKASIMDHQYIQNIETFCDDDAQNYQTVHNYEAPSKHNRLCSHRSTWDIITNTEDFSNNKNPPISTIGGSQLTPTFKVLKARSRKRRAVVAVEAPLLIADQIRADIQRFLHDQKGDDVDIGIVHYADIGQNVLPMTTSSTVKDTPFNISSAAENKAADINVTNGIMEALQGIGESSEQLEGSSIVYISSSNSQRTNSTMKLVEDLRSKGTDVQFIRITGAGDFSLSADISELHGSHHPGTTVYDHLTTIFNKMSMEQHHYVNILREDIHLNDETNFHRGTFYLDPSLCVNTTVSFHITGDETQMGFNLPLPDISLQSPSGVIVNVESGNCIVDEPLGSVRYRFPNAEKGLWRYNIRKNSGSYNVSVAVRAQHSTHTDEDPIILRHQVKANPEQRRIELFCDVTRGNHPVVGLKVTATILRHGGSTETILLLDNGAGADISKDDGVYSRYVTKLGRGIYHVTFKVLGENGQVWSKEEHLEVQSSDDGEPVHKRRISKQQVTGGLQRHIYGGSFCLHNDLHDATTDIIPPSRVTDLRVIKILPYRNSVILSWTAPGDDLDSGKVAKYQLYIARNIKDVRRILTFAQTGGDQDTIVKETAPAGKSAGETEVFLWNMGDTSSVKSFTFAIQAVDEAGNVATISNIATTGFANK